MKNNQRGDVVEGVVVSVAVVLAVTLLWVFWRGYNQGKVFSRWSVDCSTQGGYVVQTYPNWWDCMVDGKVVILSGYESYQKDKPLELR